MSDDIVQYFHKPSLPHNVARMDNIIESQKTVQMSWCFFFNPELYEFSSKSHDLKCFGKLICCIFFDKNIRTLDYVSILYQFNLSKTGKHLNSFLSHCMIWVVWAGMKWESLLRFRGRWMLSYTVKFWRIGCMKALKHWWWKRPSGTFSKTMTPNTPQNRQEVVWRQYSCVKVACTVIWHT